MTPEASRTRCSGSTVPAHCLLAPAASSRRGPWCTRERGRRVAPAGDPARLRPARRCVVTAPWQECGEELAEREQQMAKCASARASRAGAEGARRDTMPGGGGALATVLSGQSQAATGQHDGSALLQPGLTCTGRTETLLSSGARHRIWANFDRRHSSPRARSDKMLTVWKSRLVHRKRLPCEPAAGWLVVDCRGRLLWLLCS